MNKVEEDVLLRYLYFCSNPLRGDEQVAVEYEMLKAHPRVTGVAFYRNDVLMVGTDEIILRETGSKYVIGEFIIFLIRKRVGMYWEVDFRFWNITTTLTNDDSGVVYIHPHIFKAVKDNPLDCPNGALCIQKGQFDVYQYIRRGEIHHAVPRLIEILETYPTGTAYREASNWPLWSKKDD